MRAGERETFLIEDLATLEAINSPTRLRILYQLIEPATARDVADGLGVPVTRLYYHLDALEAAGLIRVVETRKSGARLQRVYQMVATRFQPGPGLLKEAQDPRRVAEATVGAVLDGARLDAVAGVIRQLEAERRGEKERIGHMGRSVVRLNAEDAARFAEKLVDLADEMSEYEDLDGDEYALSFVFFPMVGPVKGGS